MPRSGRIIKRQLPPDPIYGSRLLHRFINRVMVDGKKSIAQSLVYKALDNIQKTTGKDPVKVFETAITNVSPRMEVRPRRIGGASYQIPVEVRGDRREALAIRWIIEGARAKANKDFHTFDLKLAVEIIDASELKGSAMSKKETVQRTADANRAFSHFRW